MKKDGKVINNAEIIRKVSSSVSFSNTALSKSKSKSVSKERTQYIDQITTKALITASA
jgi:hypothetical protein